MELILIRHFPTPGNRLRQYIGSTDEHLDADAIKEVETYPPVDAVVASPMKRCLETAELLYPEREVMICPEMRECDFGLFEGKTYEQLKDHPAYRHWLSSGGMEPFPEGESRENFQKRCIDGMIKTVDALLEKSCMRAAVIVHGGTIMSVLSEFDIEKREFYHWQVANGRGYSVYVDEENWKQGIRNFTQITEI